MLHTKGLPSDLRYPGNQLRIKKITFRFLFATVLFKIQNVQRCKLLQKRNNCHSFIASSKRLGRLDERGVNFERTGQRLFTQIIIFLLHHRTLGFDDSESDACSNLGGQIEGCGPLHLAFFILVMIQELMLSWCWSQLRGSEMGVEGTTVAPPGKKPSDA